jgi:uncharacterized protein (TIGR02246 family)
MKRIIIYTCLFMCACNGRGQSDSADYKSIRLAVKNLNEIWNRHDMDAYCDLFTEDATWVNILGMFWQNKTDLCKAHKIIKEVALKYWTAEMNLVKIRFIMQDVALVYIYETGYVEHEFDASPTKKFFKGDIFHDRLFLVYKKINNNWKITAGQNTTVDDTMSKFDPIKSK